MPIVQTTAVIIVVLVIIAGCGWMTEWSVRTGKAASYPIFGAALMWILGLASVPIPVVLFLVLSGPPAFMGGLMHRQIGVIFCRSRQKS